ncbi:MAG: (2Fe-2S)-binding protein [Deltaproteobacteria bacterium]|nr:(2Fe-2S)-binding protein [Deltaproteobacteria bacterium]
MSKHPITLTINDQEYSLYVAGHHTLLQVMRDQLNLTEVKYGCGRGECGACSVLVDDKNEPTGRKVVDSCLALAAAMNGKKITTSRGLGGNGQLNDVQQAFVDESGIQCGFCTPGMVVKSTALLEKNPKATEDEIRFGLEGNICRCTGYVKIVDSVKKAQKVMSKNKK